MDAASAERETGRKTRRAKGTMLPAAFAREASENEMARVATLGAFLESRGGNAAMIEGWECREVRALPAH